MKRTQGSLLLTWEIYQTAAIFFFSSAFLGTFFWVSITFESYHFQSWYLGFPFIGKFWSCCCRSFHWLSVKLTIECPVSSHSLWLFPCWLGPVLMIIWETFHGEISLNSVVLLLILDFVSGYRLEYPSSLEVSDQARLISMVFSCCHSSLESFFFSFVPTE